MASSYHYSKKYHRAVIQALIFGILGFVLLIPMLIGVCIVAFYNTQCVSTINDCSIDGSSCSYELPALTPSSAPFLYLFLFLWLAVIITLAVLAIVSIVRAKENKVPIPYTPDELAQMEQRRVDEEQRRIAEKERRQASMVYMPAYYTYNRRQKIFGIVAGACGANILTLFPYTAWMIVQYASSTKPMRLDDRLTVITFIIMIIVFAVAVIISLIMVGKYSKLKKQNMILKQNSSCEQTAQNDFCDVEQTI